MYLTIHAVARRISPRKKIFRSGTIISTIISGFDPMKNLKETTTLYLKEFEQINVLPPQLKRRCTIYNNDQDLVEAFIENQVVFHKSCVSVYNKYKLNRKQKHAKSFNVRDAPENSSESDPIEVRVSHSNIDF